MFSVNCRETGYFIELANTLEEAEKIIFNFEEEDKRDGDYEPDFYEIKKIEE